MPSLEKKYHKCLLDAESKADNVPRTGRRVHCVLAKMDSCLPRTGNKGNAVAEVESDPAHTTCYLTLPETEIKSSINM